MSTHLFKICTLFSACFTFPYVINLFMTWHLYGDRIVPASNPNPKTMKNIYSDSAFGFWLIFFEFGFAVLNLDSPFSFWIRPFSFIFALVLDSSCLNFGSQF